jgi:hypothetical protein
MATVSSAVLAVPAGLIFEPLWLFADMYIFLWWCFVALQAVGYP